MKLRFYTIRISENIVFPTKPEFSYFSVNFRLKLFLWIFSVLNVLLHDKFKLFRQAQKPTWPPFLGGVFTLKRQGKKSKPSWISTVVFLQWCVSKPIRVVTCLETTLGSSYLEQTYKFYIAWSNSWSDKVLGNEETHYCSSLSIFLIFHRFSLWHPLKTWCKFSRRNPGIVMSSSHPHAHTLEIMKNFRRMEAKFSWHLIDSSRPIHFKTFIFSMYVSL